MVLSLSFDNQNATVMVSYLNLIRVVFDCYNVPFHFFWFCFFLVFLYFFDIFSVFYFILLSLLFICSVEAIIEVLKALYLNTVQTFATVQIQNTLN